MSNLCNNCGCTYPFEETTCYICTMNGRPQNMTLDSRRAGLLAAHTKALMIRRSPPMNLNPIRRVSQ